MARSTGSIYFGGTLAAIAIAVALGKCWRHVGSDATQGALRSPSVTAQPFDALRSIIRPTELRATKRMRDAH